ncbi:MAG TPA: hypothetical protein VHV82_22375 [Sporichthyaceae bacterium]|jgi:hypothetical protein|nr:hypothetical protein [Sporichthyaceae bacterium]
MIRHLMLRQESLFAHRRGDSPNGHDDQLRAGSQPDRLHTSLIALVNGGCGVA